MKYFPFVLILFLNFRTKCGIVNMIIWESVLRTLRIGWIGFCWMVRIVLFSFAWVGSVRGGSDTFLFTLSQFGSPHAENWTSWWMYSGGGYLYPLFFLHAVNRVD